MSSAAGSSGSLVNMTFGEYYYSDGTISADILSGKTILGVCVVPASHMMDGYPRVMALWDIYSNGRKVTSQNGSAPLVSWDDWDNGTPHANLRLTNYTTVPKTSSGNYTYGSTQNYGGLGSETSINSMTTKSGDYYYHSNYTSKIIPSPYLANGNANPAYRTSGTATSDFDGWGNTDVIVAANGIAAKACRSYAPTTATSGKWYLPACGELGYVVPKLGDINTMLTNAGGVALSTSNYKWYWSSSESSIDYAWIVNFNTGLVNDIGKGSEDYVRPFLATWQLG